jgi:hypothetical protein
VGILHTVPDASRAAHLPGLVVLGFVGEFNGGFMENFLFGGFPGVAGDIVSSATAELSKAKNVLPR